MERYETLFAQLKSRQEGAFVPFVTLGDPNPALSLQIIDTLIEAGRRRSGAGYSPSPTRWPMARLSRAQPCVRSPLA
ncbi:Tryptophan synthase alpha chain [Raoultella terrigena]|uniref:tryptophan synthase n=1 Tax=Raoultella terrigena TaxID=577 RepID=A0A4U9CTK2_RAOTE|nr:Tryptophan synthase alpha chain [Raoultella terrigena]